MLRKTFFNQKHLKRCFSKQERLLHQEKIHSFSGMNVRIKEHVPKRIKFFEE